MRAGLCLVACGAALLGASPVMAKQQVDAKTTYYAVSGWTVRDLRAQMRTLGPSQVGKTKHWGAMTFWNLGWHYRYSRVAGQCVITDINVKVEISYIMPKWVDEDRGNPHTRARWQSFIGALATHEQGHAQHGVDAGAEIERVIAAQPPSSSCDAVGAAAYARGVAIVQKYRAIDIDYDRQTDNGRTQGAVLMD
jgi:predicted secreted Zn-dependent protease